MSSLGLISRTNQSGLLLFCTGITRPPSGTLAAAFWGLQNTFPHLSPNVVFVAIHAPYIGRDQGSRPLAQDTAGSPSPDLSPSEPCWLLLLSSLLHAGAGIHATGQRQAPSSHGSQVPVGKDSGCPAEGQGGSPLVGQEWVPSSLWYCPQQDFMSHLCLLADNT